jgi:hypothetical protein
VIDSLKRNLLLCCLLPLALSGCAGSVGAPTASAPQVALSCIAVLPVSPVVDYEGTTSVAEVKVLKEGSLVLDNLVKGYFSGRQDIRYATSAQLQGLDASLAGNTLKQARAVAGHFSCNAVLEVTMNQYRDRVGGDLSAEEPAAVSFDYRLLGVESGTALCQGRYEEEQQSVLENLFNFGRASARGFRWVTAETLLREGLAERFAECPYLAAP